MLVSCLLLICNTITTEMMILVIEKLMLYVGHMFFGQVSGSRTQWSFLIYWTGHGKQTVTLSWFPPPQVWDGKRSGFRWLEWVERDEAFFLDILLDIQMGRHQPLTHTQWQNRLRGFKPARELVSNNEKRSQHFLDSVCPIIKQVSHLSTF